MAVTATGARQLPAARDAVWTALNDVTCLQRCIPGCQSLTRVSDTNFALSVLVRLGPVQVVVDGSVEVFDSDPPRAYSLRGFGSGGFLGDASGTMRISLSPSPGGCRLAYEVEAEARGPLAALGPIFLAGMAKTLSGQFVQTLADAVGTDRSDAAAPPACGKPTMSPPR